MRARKRPVGDPWDIYGKATGDPWAPSDAHDTHGRWRVAATDTLTTHWAPINDPRTQLTPMGERWETQLRWWRSPDADRRRMSTI